MALCENVDGAVFQKFVADVRALGPEAKILELGTRRWGPAPTHHRNLFLPGCSYVMSDAEAGEDVDVVADAHELERVFGTNSFDAVIASSVWEHLERPWIAAQQLLTILKPGGLAYIQTHFSFCEHGYPHDYYRFTTRALETQFKSASQVTAFYEFPAQIISEHDKNHPQTWLNTCALVKK